MEIQQYVNHIKQGIIPESSPQLEPLFSPNGVDKWEEGFKARRICNEYGMWAIVDQCWTKQLSDWIGKRKVLEIMAGAGWLAKALNDHGVNIVATDDYSWDDTNHKKMKRVHPVKKIHALGAIATIKADILLVSWPPYGDETICACCRLWGKRKPVIYIGEGYGGCNAPDEFFEHFKVKSAIDIPQWPGLHDSVLIGKYR